MTPTGGSQEARLVRLAARDLDASWIGREMIVDGTACGVLSDVEVTASAVTVFIAGDVHTVAPDAVVLVDTLAAR